MTKGSTAFPVKYGFENSHRTSNNCVGIITLGSYGPTYLKSMLNVDIKTNGILSGLPMLSRYVGGLLWGAIGKMFFMGYQ